MINNYLERQIKENFPYQPTPEQEIAVKSLSEFLLSPRSEVVFMLRGYAGTGKTSLVGALVRTLDKLQQKSVLLAPTGRAAKVFSAYAGHPAFTIHKKIYRQQSFSNELSNFSVNDNLTTHTLYIVDEASMISNEGLSGSMFGTGRLLDDLVQFVYSGQGCRLLLMGDTAQLPPVGEEESPALMADFMAGYGLKVYQCDLNEILRQASGSGILYNATEIRSMITHDEVTRLPKITFSGFADIRMVPGGELIEQLNSSYSEVGTDETIVITRSNKRANAYNAGIRGMVLGREEELTTGDMLMVVRNNYYWTEKAAAEEKALEDSSTGNGDGRKAESQALPFIANGDRAMVVRVRNLREFYGLHFADVWLQFPDYDNYEIMVTAVTDSLMAEAPALTREQSERLFNGVMEDYQDVPLKADRLKKVRQDPCYNALQIKYAYAVTCHKAQGGQWAHIYVDQGYMTDDMLSPDYIHWLYTAFTRATEKLFLVNWPKTQTEG